MHLADRYRQDMIARNPPFNGFGLERQPVEHTDPSANSGYYNPIPAPNQQYYNIPPPQAPMNPMRPNKVPTAEPRPAPAGQWTGADLGDVGNLLTTLTTPENPGLVTTPTPLRTQPEYVNMHTFSNGNGYMDNVGNSRSSSSPASAYQVPSPVSSVHSQNGVPSQAYSPHSQQGYNSSPSPHMMYPYSPSNQSSVASPGSQQNVPSPSNHFNGEISPGSDQNTMYGAPPFSSDTKQFGDNNPSFNCKLMINVHTNCSMVWVNLRTSCVSLPTYLHRNGPKLPSYQLVDGQVWQHRVSYSAGRLQLYVSIDSNSKLVYCRTC